MENRDGKFIVFEGLETTRLKGYILAVEKDFLKYGDSFIKVNFPSGLALNSNYYQSNFEKRIEPLLKSGITVVAEHFSLPSVVNRLLQKEKIKDLEQEYKEVPLPDLTIYFEPSNQTFNGYNSLVENRKLAYEKAVKSSLAGCNVERFFRIDDHVINNMVIALIEQIETKGYIE